MCFPRVVITFDARCGHRFSWMMNDDDDDTPAATVLALLKRGAVHAAPSRAPPRWGMFAQARQAEDVKVGGLRFWPGSVGRPCGERPPFRVLAGRWAPLRGAAPLRWSVGAPAGPLPPSVFVGGAPRVAACVAATVAPPRGLVHRGRHSWPPKIVFNIA